MRRGLDIRTAIVSTIGADVVDSFYVRHAGEGPLPGGRRRATRCATPSLKALEHPVAFSGCTVISGRFAWRLRLVWSMAPHC